MPFKKSKPELRKPDGMVDNSSNISGKVFNLNDSFQKIWEFVFYLKTGPFSVFFLVLL